MEGLKLVLKRFSPYFKDYIPYFVIAIVGMFLAAGGTAATAYMVRPLLDDIFVAKDADMLKLLPFAIIAIYFAKESGRFMQSYYTALIGNDIIRRFRNKVLKNLLIQDISFFHKYRTGELISRNTNDIEKVKTVVSNMIPDAMREILTIIALVCVVIYQSPSLAFYALIILPLAIIPLSKLARRMKKVSREAQEKISDLTAKLSEIFSNVEIIQASSSQKYETDIFAKENQRYFKLTMKSVKVNQLVSPMMETLGSIGVATVVMVGGMEVIEGNMTIGSFFSFLAALFMLYTPIKRLSGLYNLLQEAIAASERIFFLLDHRPTIKGGEKELSNSIQSVEFEGVELRYGHKKVLDRINLKANKGEFIALVGDSGGGKSSLVNMIVRFYDPTKGSIKINGTDIRELTLKSLRDSIAIITQKVYIFCESVATNIAYGQSIDENRVIEALKKANAYEFVQELSEGIHTLLDESGTNLSGGQRQRIAIARAIYSDSKILIMDEATSALDTQSEKKITQAIKNLIKDKITFVIAHRLSTVQKAHKIVVLKQGQIVAIGADKELIKSSKEYVKLKGLVER